MFDPSHCINFSECGKCDGKCDEFSIRCEICNAGFVEKDGKCCSDRIESEECNGDYRTCGRSSKCIMKV